MENLVAEDLPGPSRKRFKASIGLSLFESVKHVLSIDCLKYEDNLPEDDLEEKVIIVSNCDSAASFLKFAKNVLTDFIDKTSHCFIVVVELNDDSSFDIDSFKEELSGCLRIWRPIVVELKNVATKKQTIFFKPTGLVDYEVIIDSEDALDLDDPSVDFSPSSKLFSTLRLYVKALREKNFKDANRVVDILVNYSITNHCDITARLVTLFAGSFGSEVTDLAVKSSTPSVLISLIDSPFYYDVYGLDLDNVVAAKLNFETLIERLLFSVAEEGTTEMLEFLINFIFHEDRQNCPVSDYALKARKWKNLEILIRNDFKFPEDLQSIFNIVIDDDDGFMAVIDLCKDRINFHEALEKCDLGIVESFVKRNPNLKFAFNFENDSALATASHAAKKSKNFDAYALLRSHSFIAARDESHENFLRRLSKDEKLKIVQASYKNYDRSSDSHISFLMAKSRLSVRNDSLRKAEYFEKIKEYFEQLNEIEEIVPILRVVENSDALSIIFDFNHKSIHKADPFSDQSTFGATYYKTRCIFIGANAPHEEVLGTLAHELMHFATNVLFDNDSNPFAFNDDESKREYEAIVKECKEMKESNTPLVKAVFNIENYDDERNDDSDENSECHNTELIVRVPHMLAYFKDSQPDLDNLRTQYKKLFAFYGKVCNKIEVFIKDPVEFRHSRRVQQLNGKLGHIAIASKYFNAKSVDGEILHSNSTTMILCDVPKLATSSIFQTLLRGSSSSNVKASNIFVKAKDFKVEPYVSEFYSLLCTSKQRLTFVITCEPGDSFRNSIEFWNFIKAKELNVACFIICSLDQADIISNELELKLPRIGLTYEWVELLEDVQDELLNRKIIFQDRSLKLNQLVDKSSPSLSRMPLKALFLKEVITIGSAVTLSKGFDKNYFIPRQFIERLNKEQPSGQEIRKVEWNSEFPLSIDSVLKQTDAQKIVVISDDAGIGKSVALTALALKIKEKYPNRLIVRIDLHLFTKFFESINKSKLKETMSIFMNPRNEFEKALFRELFDSKKLVVLFDGFDEVAPKHTEAFLKLLKDLKTSPVAQVWVTTRPHLSQELEIDMTTYRLQKFSLEDQINFMTRFWKVQFTISGSELDEKRLRYCAEQMFDQLRNALDQSVLSLIGIPLQCQMLAEIFEEDVQKYLKWDGSSSFMADSKVLKFPNLIYRRFVDKKFEIYLAEKGKTVTSEAAKMFGSSKLMEIHERIALSEIFEIEVPQNSDTIDNDMLQRLGLITIINGRPIFIHRTFAEFLAAEFIVKNLPSCNDEILLPIFHNIIFDSISFKFVINMVELEIKYDGQRDVSVLHTALAKFLDEFFMTDYERTKGENLLLHRLVRNQLFQGNSETFDFIVKILKLSHKHLVQELLTSCVSGGENIFMFVCRYLNFPLFSEIWDLAKLAYENEVGSYFLLTDGMGLNAFQIMFLVSYREFPNGNSMLKRLYDIAKDCLSSIQLQDLIVNCKHCQTMNNCRFWKPSCRDFPPALDFKWNIAKEFSGLTPTEIINTDNLYTFSIRFIIESDHRNGDIVKEVFDWARKKLAPLEHKAFRMKFYPLVVRYQKVGGNED